MATPRLPVPLARHSAPGQIASVIKVDTYEGSMPEGGYPLLAGFEPVRVPEHKRLVVSVDGEPKTGKTTFALTFPKPLLYMNLDFGIDELVVQHPELWDSNSCQQVRLQMNELTDPGTWGRLLEEFHDKYVRALEYVEMYGGTVVTDTATQLWQVVQAVKIEHVRAQKIAKIETRRWESDSKKDEALDRANKSSQLDWGLANAFMGGLLRRSMHCKRANAVFLHRVKPFYNDKGVRVEGEWEFHGYGETPAIVQTSIRTYRQVRQTKGGPVYIHRMRIRDCRFGTQWQGFEMDVPPDPYGTLVGMLYPADTDEVEE